MSRFTSILRDVWRTWASAVDADRLRSGLRHVRGQVEQLARSLLEAVLNRIDRARVRSWLQRGGEVAVALARVMVTGTSRLAGAVAAVAPSRAKLSEWLWRYLPLEIIATITALMGAGLVSLITSNQVALAFAGTWGENVGFYGYAAWRDYRTHQGFLRLAGHMLVEFGPAEALDSFVVRPACMYLGQQMTGSLGWGIALGKVAADVVFYVLVILSYELKKTWLR